MSAIDLRSDTVTRPTDGMRRAMADAVVGDDVLDGDPTTGQLEARVAALLGHEAALFFPSGTQANQVGVALHVRAGDELILEATAHLLDYEQGALAGLWGIQPRPVPTADGLLTADLVQGAMRSGRYLPRIGAVAVENTHNAAGGTVMPVAALAAIRALGDELGLPIHLDGARLWNAAAALEVPLEQLAGQATTVMVSFSKGLGCPVGSCLAGSRALLERAWVLRKRLGGGMRQTGILAAACLYALEHHLPHITGDHANARRLAAALAEHPRVRVVPPETNIVMLHLAEGSSADAVARLAARDVLVVPFGAARVRAVLHRDIGTADVDRAAAVIAETLA